MNPGKESSENLIGEIIRRQRELAELSMRQVAADVLETIAATLGVPPETLRPPTRDDDHGPEWDHDHEGEHQPAEHASFVAAISTDPELTARQRRALIEIYTAMTAATTARRSRRSS